MMYKIGDIVEIKRPYIWNETAGFLEGSIVTIKHVYSNGGLCVVNEEGKEQFFKIEQVERIEVVHADDDMEVNESDFNDLVKLAMTAVEDKKISSFKFCKSVLHGTGIVVLIMHDGSYEFFRKLDVEEGIKFIKSLYEKEASDMSSLIENIKQWFIDRNLHTANPQAQIAKLLEEAGELSKGVTRRDEDLIKDGIGDVVVVLIGLCTQLDLDFEECVALAYSEIKDRKGKLIDGVFVKEEDL